MTGGPLLCCKTLCCVFLVFINILSIVSGLVFTVVGILILWGAAAIQSLSSIVQSDGGSANATVQSGIFGSDGSVANYYSSLAAVSGSVGGLLIGLGIVIVVVSCIGCFGACIGIPACLIIYVVCVCILFVGQVIVIIIWFANSNLFKKSIRSTLEEQVQKYRGHQKANVESVTLNMIQALFGCCGVDNGTDFYVASSQWNRTHSIVGRDNKTIVFNLTYPVSCCKYDLSKYELIDPYCPYNGSTNAGLSNYKTGCHEKVWLTIETHWQLNRFFYGLCGCLGLEILLIVGALVICQARRQLILESSGSHAEVEYKVVSQKA